MPSMRVDVIDTDGVIQFTCNIPDALWTTDVQTAANAAAANHGMTLDVADPDDTIDPHVQLVTTKTDLIDWINAHTYTALGTGPVAPGAGSTSSSSGVVVAVVAVAAIGVVGALGWWLSRR